AELRAIRYRRRRIAIWRSDTAPGVKAGSRVGLRTHIDPMTKEQIAVADGVAARCRAPSGGHDESADRCGNGGGYLRPRPSHRASRLKRNCKSCPVGQSCQDRRHGARPRSALARALRAQRNRDQQFDGTQANRQMAHREGPALYRVRQGAAGQMLRGMDVGEKGRAATRETIAVARDTRAADQGKAMLKKRMTLAVAMTSLPAIALAQTARSPAPSYCFDLSRVVDLAMTKERICFDRRPSAPGQLSGYQPGIGRIARSTAPRPIPATLRRWTRRKKPRRHGRQSSIKSKLVSGRAGPRPPRRRLPTTC